jgi:hypothetical protein
LTTDYTDYTDYTDEYGRNLPRITRMEEGRGCELYLLLKFGLVIFDYFLGCLYVFYVAGKFFIDFSEEL